MRLTALHKVFADTNAHRRRHSTTWLRVCFSLGAISVATACAGREVSALPVNPGVQVADRQALGAPASLQARNVSDVTFARVAPIPNEPGVTPADSTNDLCIAPAAPFCGIQGQSLRIAVMLVNPPAGLSVAWSARNLPRDVTATFDPQTSTAPPYATTETLHVGGGARVTNRDAQTVVPACRPAGAIGCGATTVGFEVMCSLGLGHCPALEIDDANRAPSTVSGNPAPTVDTVVGYQANLSVRYQPGSGSTGGYSGPAEVAWGIPGDPIESYDRDGKPPIPLGAAARSASNVRFYYYLAGRATLTVSGRLVRNDGEEVAAAASQARYNVRTPTVFASVQTTAVTQESAQGTTRLTFSRGNTAGIAFNYRVADVPGYHGQISATQVIDSSSSTVLAAGGATATNHAPGGPWLDLDADYPPGPAPSTSTWRSTDSPATGLNVAWKSYVRADRFTTYLMYKPNAHGIWVTLGAIDWGWSGFAARTGSNAWCLGGTPGCPMTTPSNWTVKPKVQVSATFPTWIAVRQAPNARP